MKTLAALLALFCLGLTNLDARESVSGAEVTGTFRNKYGSEFRIEALGGGKLHIEFHGLYEYRNALGEQTANVGYGDGTATITGDTAVFHPEGSEENCAITLKFPRPGQLVVVQDAVDSDCGFGHNVSASGTYKKVSSKKPKFGEDT
jgi:hypothetical protein